MGRKNLGHALETAVFIELLRRGFDIHYLRTSAGHEVDFHAVDAGGHTLLMQVCADVSDSATLDRETRSLVEAHAEHPEALPILLLLDPPPPGLSVPDGVEIVSAVEWLLEN